MKKFSIDAYCIVLLQDQTGGYILDRDYDFVCELGSLSKVFVKQILDSAVESAEDYKVFATPERFKGLKCWAYWMY